MTQELFGHIKQMQTDDLEHVIRLVKDINAKNSHGQTALHLAVLHQNSTAVDLLLLNGANVDVLDDENKSPIEYAAEVNNRKLIKTLLNHGASIHIDYALLRLCGEHESTTVSNVLPIAPGENDPVTGLANRQQFMEILRQAIIESKKKRVHVLLFYIDINQFKDINDTMGHRMGDQLLLEMGQRLSEVVQEKDTVARVGNDEFLILQNEVAFGENGSELANQIIQVLSKPFDIESHEIQISVNMGIALSSPEFFDPDVLITRASLAMETAKEQGINQYVYFSETLNTVIQKRTLLSRKLINALENKEFNVVYQPQVEIKSNMVIGSEALLRWVHPQIGQIPPDEFIPVLENMGLIEEVTIWVIEQAISQHQTWIHQQLMDEQSHVSVNLSAKDFRNASLCQQISDLLTQYEMPAHQLHVEITEGLFISHHREALEKLDQMHQLGLKIALDDFGTGYCSLRYLKQFPIDIIKIDRSFIREILDNPEDTAITAAIISLAQTLDIEVIAEGVEDKDALEFLQALGCQYFQGYLCSAPVKPQEWDALIQHWKRNAGTAAL